MNQRVRIHITGRVQGVGFRPTMYRYARALALTGFVKNTTAGVVVEIQGKGLAVTKFLKYLGSAPPPQARIDSLRMETLPVTTESSSFEILASSRSGDLRAGLPPDLATCEDCRAELFDPINRRYQYPFINCTNCGPRFTIIRKLPYDRKHTSMKVFDLCPQCRAEYLEPADRRFDAQPNACPVCGPRVKLILPANSQEKHPTSNAQHRTSNENGERFCEAPLQAAAAIQKAVQLLKAGRILAVKGLGGYHLSCDAINNKAVARLRERKGRPHKSLAVMFASMEALRNQAKVSDAEERELTSPAAPIVIVRRKNGSNLSELISPDTKDIGVFLPYTPVHHLLLTGLSPLVMTSGNSAKEPIAMDEEQLQRILGPIADAALIHNRPILRRCDDSVLRISNGQRLVFRRSRGLVPDPIPFPRDGPAVLACGADLKNTICMTRGKEAFLSQHIGDLEEHRAFRFFRETIVDLTGLLKVQPAIIAHDLHPDYHSTRYALSPGIGAGRRVAVQHHHAHIAAGMAENRLKEPVIGVALDGTGYGPDGTIWGGEFLIADFKACRRAAHFKTYRMPGGAEAIRRPERMAFSLLLAELPPNQARENIGRLLPNLSDTEWNTLAVMIHQGLNSPFTSSAGRLFDVVAVLLGVGDAVSYEARGAVRLQTLAHRHVTDHYPFDITPSSEACLILSFGSMIRALVADTLTNTDRAVIAGKFHNTVAEAVVEVCGRIRAQTFHRSVVLSGGVFQNDLLLERTTKGLLRDGFQVYSHHVVPPNDGGLALGQAAVARQKCRM